MGKLTVLTVKNAKAGRHGDGQGLYLLVKPSGARSWLLRVQVDDRRRDIGLGSIASLTLAEAREKAAVLRKVARAGCDPVHERDKDRKPIPSFKAAAIACHAEMARGWAPKHAAAFLSSLSAHVFPTLGKMRVDLVTGAMIRDTLAPIWVDVPVTARKVRQRIGMVLNFAKVKGWRTSETPTVAVTMGLAKHGKGGNFAAMPYVDVPAFMAQVRTEAETVGRLALTFTLLTAARSGETRSALWSHIDLESGLWTRPAALMKSREEHAVALSGEAVAVLQRTAKMRSTSADCLIFPGKGGKPLSDMTLTKILRDAGVVVTVHGFRSSFRDWAAEMMPTIPGEVAEAALAHVTGTKTTRAYLRTDFMELRRKLAGAWASYCLGQSSNVVRLASAA